MSNNDGYDYDEIYLNDPEADREWMECEKHWTCRVKQGESEALYEALSSYPLEELDDEQRAFIKWFDHLANDPWAGITPDQIGGWTE